LLQFETTVVVGAKIVHELFKDEQYEDGETS
jgi:hypothetical protein